MSSALATVNVPAPVRLAPASAADVPAPVRLAPASAADVPAIVHLLAQAAPDCIALSAREVFAHLEEHVVARDEDDAVVGTVGVRPISGGRVELRSLAVSPACRGLGVGRRLVDCAIARAQHARRRLVCVTMRPSFFAAHGFREIPLAWVPEKPERAGLGRRRVAMMWQPVAAILEAGEERPS